MDTLKDLSKEFKDILKAVKSGTTEYNDGVQNVIFLLDRYIGKGDED